jgi:hypothetical protein
MMIMMIIMRGRSIGVKAFGALIFVAMAFGVVQAHGRSLRVFGRCSHALLSHAAFWRSLYFANHPPIHHSFLAQSSLDSLLQKNKNTALLSAIVLSITHTHGDANRHDDHDVDDKCHHGP